MAVKQLFANPYVAAMQTLSPTAQLFVLAALQVCLSFHFSLSLSHTHTQTQTHTQTHSLTHIHTYTHTHTHTHTHTQQTRLKRFPLLY